MVNTIVSKLSRLKIPKEVSDELYKASVMEDEVSREIVVKHLHILDKRMHNRTKRALNQWYRFDFKIVDRKLYESDTLINCDCPYEFKRGYEVD